MPVGRTRWGLWLLSGSLAFVVLFAALFGVAVLGMLGGGAMGAQPSACGTTGGPPVSVTAGAPGLNPEQLGNAQAIAGVALGLGLGRPGVLLGVLTANVETDLRNLPGGDRDSVGLFQQRAPWGSFEERHDPVTATTMFFQGGKGGQPGVFSIVGWETVDPGVVMQRVQQSQFSAGTSPQYATKLAMAVAATDALMAGQPSTTAAAVTGPTSITIGPLAPATVSPCPAASAAVGVVYSPPGLEQNDSQDPSTFGWVRAGPMEPLVYQGHNFGQVATGTAKLWTAMLNELVPLIPGGLNANLGCYENRRNVNSPGVWSFHSYGLACDINYDVNANGTTAQSLQGRQFALPMATHDVLAKFCMQWGGDFKGTPDPMHVEIHCTPTQIAAWSATQP
jgi:hypothetical protein